MNRKILGELIMPTFLKMFLSIWSEIQNNCKLWFHFSGHNALTVSNQFPVFQRNIVPSSSRFRVLRIWHITEQKPQPHDQANTSTCKNKPRWNLVIYFCTVCNSTNTRAVLSATTLQVCITVIFILVDTHTNISHTSCMLGLWATKSDIQ